LVTADDLVLLADFPQGRHDSHEVVMAISFATHFAMHAHGWFAAACLVLAMIANMIKNSFRGGGCGTVVAKAR
jgi:hypothetical protein